MMSAADRFRRDLHDLGLWPAAGETERLALYEAVTAATDLTALDVQTVRDLCDLGGVQEPARRVALEAALFNLFLVRRDGGLVMPLEADRLLDRLPDFPQRSALAARFLEGWRQGAYRQIIGDLVSEGARTTGGHDGAGANGAAGVDARAGVRGAGGAHPDGSDRRDCGASSDRPDRSDRGAPSEDSYRAREAVPYLPLLADRHGLWFQRYRLAADRLRTGLQERLGQDDLDPARLPDLIARAAPVVQAVLAAPPRRPDGAPLRLDEAQQAGVVLAILRKFVVITGGPGTGKTSVVFTFLRCLLRMGLAPHRVALAAPTGRAAQRMGESLRAQLATLPVREPVDEAIVLMEPRTLHRLLGYSPRNLSFRHGRDNPLEADLILVDETSMVDVEMMSRLLEASPLEARLVLIGDKDQLPSVEAGTVLADLVRAALEPTGATGDPLAMAGASPALAGERLATGVGFGATLADAIDAIVGQAVAPRAPSAPSSRSAALARSTRSTRSTRSARSAPAAPAAPAASSAPSASPARPASATMAGGHAAPVAALATPGTACSMADRVLFLQTCHRAVPEIIALAQEINGFRAAGDPVADRSDEEVRSALPASLRSAFLPATGEAALPGVADPAASPSAGGPVQWLEAAWHTAHPKAVLAAWLREFLLLPGSSSRALPGSGSGSAQAPAAAPRPYPQVIADCLALGLPVTGEPLTDGHPLAEAFAFLGRHKILCAYRDGACGVDGLNRRLAVELAAWLPVKGWSEFFPGAVVMVTQNDYARELFNGDTGLILPAREGGLFGVFPRPGTLLRVPVDELPGPELAFAVTVHKSQGSEYDEVLLILPPPQSEAAGRLLTREVLYTAVTRAKRRVTILADARTLFTACSRGAIRAG
ncbi:MAG: Exodeoxyribonuclease V alpha chain [Candidatus Ozemobacter sibiricus]|uniref:Exodeoxyribonuclease V alpha chain n=1 Tax=Candidatus Ozemobacter sibiricus TaxID=2268124 RepID=A0A367Z8I6_9BACT|nr:MAG: Exodeoxyribonuclease V alpha chain [Candidatus Ozemobacter sibiricus]